MGRQRRLGVPAEVGECQRRVARPLNFAVARHFESHAAGRDPEGRLLLEARLERLFRLKIRFLVLNLAGHAFALQGLELALDELLFELPLVLERLGRTPKRDLGQPDLQGRVRLTLA